jgi:type IV pilus biogenesis protein CpaD/CtpE
MTPSLPRPPSTIAVRAVLVAGLLAGCAGTAASRESAVATATPPRVAVLAGADATATAIADATSGATPREVRRVGGLLEAQAQAAALAAEGYDLVIAIGPQARSAVAQAEAAEVGAGTRWR